MRDGGVSPCTTFDPRPQMPGRAVPAMRLQIALLKRNFFQVAHRHDELAEIFYDTLFSRYPDLKSLFDGVDMAEQAKKFSRSLDTIVGGMDRLEVWTRALAEMGREHLDYGVLPEHYPAVGECLVHALSVVSGSEWSEDLEKAWNEAYVEIAELMIGGAGSPAD